MHRRLATHRARPAVAVGAWAWRRRLRARAEPPRGRASGRAPRGLVSRVFTVIRRSAARRVVILRFTYLRGLPLTARAGAGGMLRKNVSTYIGVPRRGPGQGQGNTHTGVPRGRRSIRKDVR